MTYIVAMHEHKTEMFTVFKNVWVTLFAKLKRKDMAVHGLEMLSKSFWNQNQQVFSKWCFPSESVFISIPVENNYNGV